MTKSTPNWTVDPGAVIRSAVAAWKCWDLYLWSSVLHINTALPPPCGKSPMIESLFYQRYPQLSNHLKAGEVEGAYNPASSWSFKGKTLRILYQLYSQGFQPEQEASAITTFLWEGTDPRGIQAKNKQLSFHSIRTAMHMICLCFTGCRCKPRHHI